MKKILLLLTLIITATIAVSVSADTTPENIFDAPLTVEGNTDYTVLGSIKNHEIYNDVYFINCENGCDENNNGVLDALDSYDNSIIGPDMEVPDFFKSIKESYTPLNLNGLFKRGSTGESVKDLQSNLNIFSSMTGLSLGFLSPDGVYGPVTTAVVKLFQTYQGLTADGIVGVRTLGVLDGFFAGELICPPFCEIMDSDQGSERFITLDDNVYNISEPECPTFCAISPANISLANVNADVFDDCTLFCDILTSEGKKTVLVLNDIIYDISPVQCPPGCKITSPNGESFIILDGKVYEDSELLFSHGKDSININGKIYDTSARDDCSPECDILNANNGVSVILDGKVYDTSSDFCPPWCLIIPSDIITGLITKHDFMKDVYFMSCLSDCDKNLNNIPDTLEIFEIKAEEDKIYKFNFIRTRKSPNSGNTIDDICDRMIIDC